MKPSGPIKRKKALKRSTTPIRQVNPTAKAKRVKKQQAFYSSAAWKKLRKEALELAGHQCWYTESRFNSIDGIPETSRCMATTHLQVHHRKGSLRFGGNELPEDLQVLCKAHHELVEMRDHPTRHPR